MKISEMITDRYKLRIPPTVYYDLLADVRNEQEPKSYQWCTDCKEYDQEKHCCHRWSKVIRNTVEEMKQEYIEREELDKIRAEIIGKDRNVKAVRSDSCCFFTAEEVLEIIDKYKAENNS